MGNKELLNRLKYLITKKKDIDEICIDLDLDVGEVYELVIELKRYHSEYDIKDGVPIKKKNNYINLDFDRPFKIKDNSESICLISDLHYGSRDQKVEDIITVYKDCHERGVNTILCAGDFTDGYNEKIYFRYDPTDLINYIAKNHPHCDDIKLYTIGGNHDETFTKNDGIDVLEELSYLRDDIIYLGPESRDVLYNDVKIKVVHDAKKITKNHPCKQHNSLYNITKILYDSLHDKPDILQIGHIHNHYYTVVDKTHFFQTGALVNFPSYEQHNAAMSYWFANFRYDEEGNLENIYPELKFVRRR